MPQDKPLPPEKQLLNLIEKPMSKSSLHAAAIKYQGMSFLSLGALKGRLAFLENKFKTILRSGGVHQLDIATLNQVLKFCAILLAFYFIVNISVSVVGLGKDLNIKIKIEKPAEIKVSAITSLLKTGSYYLEKARERDIFKMGAKIPNTSGGKEAHKITEATQDLKLVGISWSSDPDVMIENTKTARTYFLKKGQLMDNGVRLKAVYKDRVILSYQDEEVELR